MKQSTLWIFNFVSALSVFIYWINMQGFLLTIMHSVIIVFSVMFSAIVIAYIFKN